MLWTRAVSTRTIASVAETVIPKVRRSSLLAALIEGRAWFDQSKDGERAWVSFPEYELSDVSVRLLNEAGQLVATTTTNEVGQYAFAELAAGRYQVEFVAPDGTQFTLQNQGKNSPRQRRWARWPYEAL